MPFGRGGGAGGGGGGGGPTGNIILDAWTNIVVSIAGALANNGRESNKIVNSLNRPAAAIKIRISWNLVPAPGSIVECWLYRGDGTTFDDLATGVDATLLPKNSVLLGSIENDDGTATAKEGTFDTAMAGPLLTEWGIILLNKGATNLDVTEANHIKRFATYRPT